MTPARPAVLRFRCTDGREMPDANLLVTSAVTLLAVALGAVVSFLSQSRTASREGFQQWRETRISTYGRFLAATGRCAVSVDRGDDLVRSVDEAAAVLGEVHLVVRY